MLRSSILFLSSSHQPTDDKQEAIAGHRHDEGQGLRNECPAKQLTSDPAWYQAKLDDYKYGLLETNLHGNCSESKA